MARLAGVGVGTVSRVLNRSSSVSEVAEARVQQAVEELGYRRSLTARSLSLGRSQTVGVVAPFFTTPSVIERLRGAFEHLTGGGYDVLLFAVQTPEQRVAAFRDFARRDRIDGLLLISLPLSDGEVAGILHDELPVVLIDVEKSGLAHVVIDDVLGGEIAGEHLLAKGHRRIGFVGDAPVNAFGFTSSERRLTGLRRAVARARSEHPGSERAGSRQAGSERAGSRQAGSERAGSRQAGSERAGSDRGSVIARRGRYGREEAIRLATALLRLDDPPTAIFAASDDQAFGVLEAASRRDLRVPEDVAVIGFDDIEMAAVMGLTTVRQPLFDSGAKGTDMLLRAIERGGRQPIRELQPLRLVERRTT